jgi:hypothetical protein
MILDYDDDQIVSQRQLWSTFFHVCLAVIILQMQENAEEKTFFLNTLVKRDQKYPILSYSTRV